MPDVTLEKDFPISISETDCAHMVKPVVILNYMQDLAADSIAKYNSNYSCEELLKKGLGWFLIRYRIEFDDYPSDMRELKIKTEYRGAQRHTTYRDFEVYNNVSGQRVLRAFSSWLIVDLCNKTVINISKDFPDLLQFEKRDDDLVLQKLKQADNFDCEKSFSVRYDDLDINGHVNNTVYITWALEALDYDFRMVHKFKSMDIYFKHEAKYGDEIISQVRYNKENLTSEHVIKNIQSGEELCLIKIEYRA